MHGTRVHAQCHSCVSLQFQTWSFNFLFWFFFQLILLRIYFYLFWFPCPSLALLRTFDSCKISAIAKDNRSHFSDGFQVKKGLSHCHTHSFLQEGPEGALLSFRWVLEPLLWAQCYLLLPSWCHVAVSCTSHCFMGICAATSSHVSVRSHLMRVTEIPWEEEFKVSQTMVWLTAALS